MRHQLIWQPIDELPREMKKPTLGDTRRAEIVRAHNVGQGGVVSNRRYECFALFI